MTAFRFRTGPGERPGAKRWIAWGAGILATVALLIVAFARDRSSGPPPGSRFQTVVVERGKVTARVTASGTLSALVTVQVGSQITGRIKELHVDFNSPVRKGQMLAEIDSRLFDAAVEQARANLAAAQGNLARARFQAQDSARQSRRLTALAQEQGIVSPADQETAQAAAEAAAATVTAQEGEVQQARAALHQAEVNLGYTRIVSPTDGIVISRDVDVGQTVAASLQAPTLFTIAQDLSRMQVDTAVAEADIGKLKAGMSASFGVDAFPGETFRGAVRQIRNAPQTVQNVVTYDAVIDVDNSSLKLRPGMTANVTFVYAEKEGILKIPNAAFRFRPPANLARAPRPEPGTRMVWVLREGEPRPLSIRTGISDGAFTEAADGELREGDRIVTEAIESSDGPARFGGPRGFGRPL
jgi:HlyD family secretion protein